MSRILVDFTEIVRDLKRFRFLLYQLTLRDIRIRYKQAAMGFCWAVFMPALVVFAGMLVRFALAHVEHRPVAGGEAAALAVKAIPWAFFVGTLQFATTSLTGNTSLVTKVYFPREVLPLAATLGQGFDALIATASLVLVLPFLGVVPSGALLWVPVLSLLLLLLTAAAALCLSCANLFFRDVKYIVQVLLTFGIFFTPVFFEPALFGRLGGRIVMLNPIAPILEGFRLSVVEGHDLLRSIPGADGWIWHPGYLLYSAGWAVAGILVSALFFHRMEILFAEYA